MNQSLPLPRVMVWQIFTKDLRLLWPLAAASTALQVLLGLLLYRSEPYALSQELSGLAALITLLLAISMILLIVLAVQQDAIPGVSQDWLVRPIKRRDLLLAKVLFVVVLLHGPMIAINLFQGLAEGYAFGQTMRATVLCSITAALVFSLPVMAIAALTKSLTEAVIGSLAAFLGLMLARVVLLGILFPFTHTFQFDHSAEGTGVAWVWQSLSHAVLLLVTVAVLIMQYARRSTFRSRAVFIGGLLLFMLTPGLPWRPAFAIQRWLSANPGADQSVAIGFERTAAAEPGPVDPQLITQDSQKESGESPGKNLAQVLLPLRFSGLAAGLVLHADRTAIRLIGANGDIVYRGIGRVLDLRAAGRDGQGRFRQTLHIPSAVYRQVADQPMRLELDYSLTLLRPHALPPLAALDGNGRLPEVGHCASKIDRAGAAIEVSCRTAGELPPCISLVLERADSAAGMPEKFVCAPNYAPSLLRFPVDAIDHFETKLPFPADQAPLHDARMVINVFEAEDHFSRRIVVPQFRLKDWRPPTTPSDNTVSPLTD
jgi:hypothetical protein